MNPNISLIWYLFPVAAFSAFMLYHYLSGGQARARSQMEDSIDPARRWARGVFGLISGDTDYAYEDKRDLQLGLSNAWGINDAAQFRLRFGALNSERPKTKQQAAWCWVRAVNLARMAAGASLISYEEAWRLSFPFLLRIQSNFAGWEDLGQNYLAAWQAWRRERNIRRRSSENVDENIELLRRSVWRETPFNLPLVSRH